MTANSTKPRSDRTAAKQARRWLTGHGKAAKRALTVTIGLGVVNAMALVSQAGLLAWVLHAAMVEGRPIAHLWPPIAGIGALMVARAGLVWAAEIAAFEAAATVKRHLRAELVRHLLSLGPGLLIRRHSGQLAVAVLEQVEAVEGYFARFVPQMSLCVLVPLVIASVAFWQNWVVGVWMLVTAPLIPLAMALIGVGVAKVHRRQFQALARLGGHFLDRLQGLGTLTLFGAARRELAAVASVSDEYRSRTMRVLRAAFLSSAALELIASVSIAMAALYLGGVLLGFVTFGVPDQGLTLFAGLFLLLLVPEFYQPLRQLAAFYHDRAAAIGAAEELQSLLAEAPAHGGGSMSFDPPAAISVQFDQVSVVHPDADRVTLADINLSIAPGERLVVTGSSGSGKTTLLAALLGFVPITSGTVRLAGQDITTARRDDVLDAVAWVGQRPVLFHGTLADNIRLGRPEADDRDVWRVAHQARVMDFAGQLPDGLATVIGERGLGLSGGQAQRVALARALLKRSKLLLLDEPTAALDPENEALILGTLADLDRSVTIVMASHSAAAQAWADRVVPLDQGRDGAMGPPLWTEAAQ